MTRRGATDPPVVAPETARRLLLDAQGLSADPGRRAGPAAVYRLVERMGFVQVDTINIVERAHHHILMSRLDGYRPAMLTRLLERDRRLFEHWTHDASVIPTVWWPYWRHRFERSRRRLAENGWWAHRMGDEPRRVLAHVRRRLRRDGPLRSRDFEHDNHRREAWWGWKPSKAALEYLWWTGEISVARRDGFHKVYDLTERVYPEHVARPRPRRPALVDWACTAALARLGVATATELAAFWRAVTSDEARRWCERAVRGGAAEAVRTASPDGARPRAAVAVPGWARRARRRPPERMRLLSPFDPVLRDRQRAARLFGFDYRFEAFVPAAKRRYGYYVMPVLAGDRLVARVDPRLDRGAGRLVIRRVWWEPGVPATKARRRALEAAVARLAAQVGADDHDLPAAAVR